MARFTALLLSLLLIVSAAFAGSANESVLDFDDFTLACDPATQLQKGERTDGQVWFTMLPDTGLEDFVINFNCTWVQQRYDLDTIREEDVSGIASSFLDALISGYTEYGIQALEPAVLDGGIGSVDGRTAVYYTVSYLMDFSSLMEGEAEDGRDYTTRLVQKRWHVSADDGMYVFTGTADNEENMDVHVQPLMDGIRWKQ